MESPVIIALDGMSLTDSLRIADETKDLAWGFKIHDLFFREGPAVIEAFKQRGRVFVDTKFHDIPATVEKEVAALLGLGADLVTVHASGGTEMLRAAVAAGGQKIAAVTALTSLSEMDTRMIYHTTPEESVRVLAGLAYEAGVRNIVCSPQEIGIVRDISKEISILTPGIRSREDPKDDQSRTTTPREAIAAGATFLVIGRPITKALHPRIALEEIRNTLG